MRRVHKIGRRRWKKEAGYDRQGRVENTFFRYKTIIGDRLGARAASGQTIEARLAYNMLNRLRDLGRPALVPIET